MKKLVATMGPLLGALLITAGAQAAPHKLTKLWESAAVLKVPESVRFDAQRKVLYVSNIDGQPWESDGKGSIAKIGLDGKVIAAEWVTGLDGPKGLALSDDGKWLFAADLGGIVVIDIDKAKVDHKIAIPEGQQLNDLVNDKTAIDYTGLALSGSTLYYGIGSGNAIHTVATIGGSFSTYTSSTTGSITVLIADATNIYWADSSKIQKCGLGSCSQPQTFATAQTPSVMAQDTASLFWANGGGEIRRLAK